MYLQIAILMMIFSPIPDEKDTTNLDVRKIMPSSSRPPNFSSWTGDMCVSNKLKKIPSVP